jgi:hypothetical protein
MIIFKLARKLKKEDGSILVIVALVFVFIVIGMSALVLDMGYSYHIASELQDLLDNTALAAVSELPIKPESDWDENDAKQYWTDKVEAVINSYANLNDVNKIDGLNNADNLIVKGIKNDNILIDKEDIDVGNIDEIYGVYIEGTAYVNNNFARFFGSDITPINRISKAILQPQSTASGVLPLALPRTVLNSLLINDSISLKLGPKVDDDFLKTEFEVLDNSNGWRGAINFLNPSNTNSLLPGGRYDLAMESGGFAGSVSEGDPVEANPGTMPVDVRTILHVSAEGSQNNIYIVPVIDQKPDGSLYIVDFVEVVITALEGNNINTEMVSIVTIQYIGPYEEGKITE